MKFFFACFTIVRHIFRCLKVSTMCSTNAPDSPNNCTCQLSPVLLVQSRDFTLEIRRLVWNKAKLAHVARFHFIGEEVAQLRWWEGWKNFTSQGHIAFFSQHYLDKVRAFQGEGLYQKVWAPFKQRPMTSTTDCTSPLQLPQQVTSGRS